MLITAGDKIRTHNSATTVGVLLGCIFAYIGPVTWIFAGMCFYGAVHNFIRSVRADLAVLRSSEEAEETR